MLWYPAICILLMFTVHLSIQDFVSRFKISPSTSDATPLPKEKSKILVQPTIRALHITSDIKYRYAITQVSSRVVNPSDQAAEATFFITLPESAFISEFLMQVKENVYKSYVKEKKEAKAIYDKAVQEGQFAGHVAVNARDSNQFTVSVNIEAHGKVTFNLTYEQLLPRKLGIYSNVININPQQIVEDMKVTVRIEEPTTITHLEVPELQTSNEIMPENIKQNSLARIVINSPQNKEVFWAPTPVQQKELSSDGANGQFIVQYDVDRKQNSQQILVDEGYFVHFFSPEELPKLRKHVVFVLDYSGSMEGRKLEQLKDAMKKILEDLDSNDYFSIVVFQSIIEVWSPLKIHRTGDFLEQEMRNMTTLPSTLNLDEEFVVKATPANIDLAYSFLHNNSDRGATNIMGGLRTGLELVQIGHQVWESFNDPPQPVIVFLTDGEPNVEEYDTNVIINKTKHLNTNGCPIFSLAFGSGADFNFLRKLSLTNYGFARNIYEAADATQQLKNFYQTVSSPLLANITFSYLPGQVDEPSNTQTDFNVYFRGSELVVAGKINKDEVGTDTTIGELRGTTANGLTTYPIIVDMKQNRSLGHLGKTWAYLTIQQLLDKADSADDLNIKNETKNRALQLAIQYSFVTPLTSLVVVKPNNTEAAIDTVKLKPGSGPDPSFSQDDRSLFVDRGGLYDSIIQSNKDGRISTAMSYDSDHEALDETDFSRNKTSSSESSNSVCKVSISDIVWLKQSLDNTSSASNVTVRIGDIQYNLGLNLSYESFGACTVRNETGECYYFQYCALNIFKENITDFIPYQCFLEGNYLGVCCPGSMI